MSAGEAHSSVAYLRSLPAIRERCERVYGLGVEGKLEHFEVHEDRVPAVAEFVEQVMHDAFPNGLKDVKFHSRWRHFEPDGHDRAAEVRARGGRAAVGGAERRPLRCARNGGAWTTWRWRAA